MDWIKVLNKHILFEYTDLKDSEFVAWIKIMALAAGLEHDPSREQILKHVHYKTLDSLQEKLKKHSIDLQYVLNKVSIDVQYVINNRERSKANTKRFRDKLKPVSDNVSITSANREEKRREENIKTPHTPRKRGDEYEPDFLIFWNAYPKKAKKPTAYREWLKLGSRKPGIASIVSAIDRQKTWRTWIEGYIPDPERWLKSERWTDEEPPQGGNGNGRKQSDNPRGNRVQPEISTPREYISDPGISEEQRAQNIERVGSLIRGIG